MPLEVFLQEKPEMAGLGTVEGEAGGCIINSVDPATGIRTATYQNYSADGKTFYNGTISLKAPASIFAAGDVIFTGDLTVTGAHEGKLDARIWFTQPSLRDPVSLSFDQADDGKPRTCGYAVYDGDRVEVSDMLP